MREPEPNATATATLRVGPADLAGALSEDPEEAFPPVFASTKMIALMELAAARLLRPLLGEGELSVGVAFELVHSAATPPGAQATATARYLRCDGKHYLFEVVARDAGGEIGRGTHRRAIVSTPRLVAGAARRVATNRGG
jgi:predicted thioesterase